MNGWAFALRGLWHYRGSYAGVLAGSALGAMVLLGALMAGDSVKETLRRVAQARLGKVDAVLSGGDRFFRAALADDVANEKMAVAPVMMLRGTVTDQRSGRALGAVRVMGVDDRFWKFAPDAGGFSAPQDREFHVNAHLARTLGLSPGESVVLRFDKPGVIASDAPLAGKSAEIIAMSGNVAKICGDREFGRFSLENTQLPQATVFVPIRRLQQVVGLKDLANLMLMEDNVSVGSDSLTEVIRHSCKLEDYGIFVVDVPLANAVEIRSRRVFFDRAVVEVIRKHVPAVQPLITYMANKISAKGRETPYSMVTAVDSKAAPFLPENPNGVVLNSWEAEDLGVVSGDFVRLDYYTLGAGNRLIEKSAVFPVAGVVPLTGLAADRMWMPDFPGVAESENAADWDAGVPIDLKRIRDKDEAYWDEHRGVPKLFLPLESGRELFGNRWGEFTALRVPLTGTPREKIARKVLESLNPGIAGLLTRDIRGEGMAAAQSPVDFAGLFIGMSLFLMVAAVSLTAMLFRFHIETRTHESGLLAALGIAPGKLIRWRMLEGLCVVTAGSVIGVVLAVAYTRLLLGLLETIWKNPGDGKVFSFHVGPGTLCGGMVGFVLLMMLVIWRVARNQSRRSAGMRLAVGSEEVWNKPVRQVPWGAVLFFIGGLAALNLRGLLGTPAAFFLGGFLFLLAGLAGYRWVLRRGVTGKSGGLTARVMAELNGARRGTRSLVVVGCLACGVFMVVSVAAFRKHAGDEWRNRDSGAGGFAFWVETTAALKSPADDPAGLGDSRGRFGKVVPFRIGAGDDASCFNLNQVTRPRLLATDVAVLSKLGAFSIKSVADGCRKDWSTLGEGSVMRAFVDESTLMWVLKRKLGDRLIYQDERGVDFPVEIAGTLDATVFQGSVVVDDARFLGYFPSAEGARVFLMESQQDADVGRSELQKILADRGAVVQTTRERLAAFHDVENTYIAVFHLLGGLGVLIGSAGLGLVTARNMMERRSEFAILHTLGIPADVTRRMVVLEVAQCIRWGLGIGLAAAMISIFPSLPAQGIWRTAGWLALWVTLIAANAEFWSWIGYRGPLRRACCGLEDVSS
ncbi:MAG: FtsX-like permease family protein [Verrucomicrobiota bacterium]